MVICSEVRKGCRDAGIVEVVLCRIWVCRLQSLKELLVVRKSPQVRGFKLHDDKGSFEEDSAVAKAASKESCHAK